jgi:hypothetical protein
MRPKDFERTINGWVKSTIDGITGGETVEVKTAPAVAVAKTDEGPALVFDPGLLLGKQASDLRQSGLSISDSVPNIACVVRDADGQLLFRWYEARKSDETSS